MNTTKKIVIQKTFVYRLKLNLAQKIKCMQFAGARRFVYNYGLNLVKNAFDNKLKIPSYTDIANTLPLLKKSSDKSWLKDIHSQVLQQTLKDLETAINHFFRGLKTKKKIGFPVFKKKGKNDSFRYPQGIRCENGKIWLPKIGWVAYYDSRPLEGAIKQVTVKRQGIHWDVAVVCEIEQAIVMVPITLEKTIGLDLGLSHFAHISDDTVIENPSFLKKELRKLAYLQRALARKKKGSSNRKKSVEKVVKKHIDIFNQRKNFVHQLSHTLVKNHDVIVVEDLCIKGMVQNRHLARAISDVGWGMFLNFLKYKCAWFGKHFLQIDRFFPSSKTCSFCGCQQEMPLSVRMYQCKRCGIQIDRDLNASLNIRAAGLAVLNACGGLEATLSSEAGITDF